MFNKSASEQISQGYEQYVDFQINRMKTLKQELKEAKIPQEQQDNCYLLEINKAEQLLRMGEEIKTTMLLTIMPDDSKSLPSFSKMQVMTNKLRNFLEDH